MSTNASLPYQRKRMAEREQNQQLKKLGATPEVMNNKLEALKVLANSILAEVASLEPSLERNDQLNVDLAGEVQRYEADLIRSALIRTGGRQRRAAALLSVKPTTLHEKMKRYGMNAYISELEPENG
ncbi:MAG: helix-turn-helix domain-containing protein [Acidobacteriota bacterium]